MERIPMDGMWEGLKFQILFKVGVLLSSLSSPRQWTKWTCHYQKVSHDNYYQHLSVQNTQAIRKEYGDSMMTEGNSWLNYYTDAINTLTPALYII